MFISILWTDVVTFRSYQTENNNSSRCNNLSCDYNQCFTWPETKAIFSRHSHHIRALTCTKRTLPTLLESNLIHLTEINFVVEPDPLHAKMLRRGTTSQGLDHLAISIANSPKLRAVSIEGLVLDDAQQIAELHTFVHTLDNFPWITCFYLSTTRHPLHRWDEIPADDPRSIAKVAALREVLEKRLDRVDGSKITDLTLRNGAEMSRSKRGLPLPSEKGKQQSQWRGRERPLDWRVEDDKSRDMQHPATLMQKEDLYPGRWENEGRVKTIRCTAIAVLESDSGGVLEVCAPWNQVNGFVQPLLRRYPGLIRYSSWGVYDTALDEALSVLGNDLRPFCLKEIEWRTVDWNNIASFLGNPRVQLSSFSLDLNYNKLRFETLLEIVRHCPKLQILQLDCTTVLDSVRLRSTSSPEFACKGLKLLKLGIFPVRNHWIGADSDEVLCEMAQLFMKQVGALEQLQELDLCFRADQVLGYGGPPSPFLQLEIAQPSGLESLNGLERLQWLTKLERLAVVPAAGEGEEFGAVWEM
ncbi:hypothetical protein BGZ81_002536 [Podila clonocystis]|nr:hypothetical protein BGZ81_002536 [Podila clonocystis]